MERPFPIIDGDGHITETEAQVRAYLPEPYRSRGGSLRAGHGYWNINLNGTLGKEARDHKTWLDAMDEGGMETAVLFPTSLGFTSSLVWEPDLHVAICKAYNDFVYDEFATNSPRLKVIASLPVQDVAECIEELARVKSMGFVGAMLPSIGKHGLFGHRKFLPLFEEAQKLDIMLAVHSATQGIHHLAADDFERFIDVNTYCFPVGLFRQFVSMMFAGIPELLSRPPHRLDGSRMQLGALLVGSHGREVGDPWSLGDPEPEAHAHRGMDERQLVGAHGG